MKKNGIINIKTLLLSGTLLIFLGGLFSSCKPESEERLIGKWTVEQALATKPSANDSIPGSDTNVTEVYKDYYYHFKYAGALTYAFQNVEENMIDTVRGNWSLHGDELMLTILDSTHHIQINSLTDNKMEWEMEGINKWFPAIHHKHMKMILSKDKQ